MADGVNLEVRMNVLRTAILSLLFVSALAWAGEAKKAKIVTSGEQPADCISAVHVNRIDNREVKVQKLGFELDPGVHSLSARTMVNTSFCKAMGIGTDRHKVQPLEAEFEAGKTYYLGYDHSSPHRRDWKLVIWKVEGGDRG